MKLSIILPAYNAESTIKETISSIQNQTFQDWELIIIDDGSQDSTFQIIESFVINDSRLITISQSNRGYRTVRNAGLDLISGEYLTFIDSDDRIAPNFFEKLMLEMKASKAQLLVTGFRKIDEKGKVLYEVKYNESISDNPLNDIGVRFIGSTPSETDSILPGVCSNCYVTSIVKEKKIRFLESKEIISEDLLFNLEYVNNIKIGKVSDIVGYDYRLNNKSVTRSVNSTNIFKHLQMINFLEKNWHQKFDNEGDVRKRLAMNFLVSLRKELFKNRKESFIEIYKRHKMLLNDLEIIELLNWVALNEFSFKRRFFMVIVKSKNCFVTTLLSMIN